MSIAFEAKTNEKYEETNLLRFFFFKTQKRTFLGSTNFLKNFFPVLAFKTIQAQMFFYSVFLKTKKKLLLIQYIVIKYMVMAHLRGQKKILKKRANHLFALFALKKQAINTKKQLLNSQPWLYPRHHGVFFFLGVLRPFSFMCALFHWEYCIRKTCNWHFQLQYVIVACCLAFIRPCLVWVARPQMLCDRPA